MIAPLRDTDPHERGRQDALHEARRIAASLLSHRPSRSHRPAMVPDWQAWLFVGWMVLASAAFFSLMLGLWRRS